MDQQWTISWVWWITAVEVPVLGCMFWLIHHGRRESERALLKVYSEVQGNLAIVVENLAQSKLEVARLYATIANLRDVEKRLTDHLIRLEARLTDLLRAGSTCGRPWTGGGPEPSAGPDRKGKTNAA